MAEVRIRRERMPDDRGRYALIALFLLAAIGMGLRSWWTPTVPAGLPIEVRGDAVRPGLYLVDPPTLAAAVEAAGGDASRLPNTRLHPGDAVQAEVDGAWVVPAEDPLLVAVPVDVNAAGAAGLAAVPGVSERAAAAIVASRAEEGPFRGIEALARVEGIGVGTVEKVSPYLSAGDVPDAPAPAGPINLNMATPEELEALPGVGPVLASRIVAEREAEGPFAAVDALVRVRGIGPATVARLGELVVVE